MAREPNRPINGIINVITGALVARGKSNVLRKAYVQSMHNISLETKRAKIG